MKGGNQRSLVIGTRIRCPASPPNPSTPTFTYPVLHTHQLHLGPHLASPSSTLYWQDLHHLTYSSSFSQFQTLVSTHFALLRHDRTVGLDRASPARPSSFPEIYLPNYCPAPTTFHHFNITMAHTARPTMSRDPSFQPHTSAKKNISSPTPLSPSTNAKTPMAPPPTQPLTSSYRPARTPAAQDVRTPSPNYFGLTIDPAQDYNSSGANSFAHAKGNWSPPGSHVRSTAAASPRVIPLDQNPEFAEFRRQTQSFGFPSARLSGFSMGPPPLGSSKIVGVKSAANGHGDGSQTTTARSAANLTSMLSPTSPRAPSSSTPQYFNQPKTTNNNNIALPSPKQRSPKRFLPSPELGILDRPRRNSPAGFNERDLENAPKFDLHLPQEAARMSLPPTQKSVAPPPLQRNQRSETLPITLGDSDPATTDGPAMVTSQHVVSLLEQDSENILLLDLRVSTQYAKSRITGALNLCIPTTLLKRPAYNLGRLADTFSHNEEQKQKFEKWRNCQYIIVYDEKSGKMTDAQSCQNTLKKFANEGWKGAQYVIRGGFNEFASRFPHLLAKNSANGAAPGSQDANEVAPVIGGCPMPASTTKTAANPFFGNIRQNMDLIGGVGQLAVKQPDNLTKQQQASVPAWLSEATESTDNGKKISDKFFQIEKREQKRMQEALSGQVHYGDSPGKADKPKGVQLAGIEKGSKNRYNNIWSYEHSRVKLECSGDSCDYVNANYMHSSRSNKRYIGTQAPIPATFNVSSPNLVFESLNPANMIIGFLECGLATRRPSNSNAYCRKGRWSDQSTRLLVRQAIRSMQSSIPL